MLNRQTEFYSSRSCLCRAQYTIFNLRKYFKNQIFFFPMSKYMKNSLSFDILNMQKVFASFTREGAKENLENWMKIVTWAYF